MLVVQCWSCSMVFDVGLWSRCCVAGGGGCFKGEEISTVESQQTPFANCIRRFMCTLRDELANHECATLAARSRMMVRSSCSSFFMLHWRYPTIKGFNGIAHRGKTYCS